MIDHVQDHLIAIYGLDCEERAKAFIVNAEVARAFGASAEGDEALLLREDPDELGLALFLSPRLLEQFLPIERRGPQANELLGDALDGYLKLAEGVSHFLYVAHAAKQDRQVSLLELEAQAEVDKFAMCVLHRWGASVATWAEELIVRLFDRVRYLPQLSSEERGRYVEANRLARRYAQRLLAHIKAYRMDRLLSELRYCYRLGEAAKFGHLGS